MFSVIIPTCNRNDQLARCLDLLSAKVQLIPADQYEVIVTDDSQDGEAKILFSERYSWAKWVEGPKRGPAANRNNGAKHANGEWLLFTDDDCLPDRNWLREFMAAIVNYPLYKAFEGAILPDNPLLLKKDLAECPVNEHGGCFWSANIMIEKQLFESIGGFDEQFRIAAQEDQDIQQRLLQKTQIKFLPNVKITHPVRIGSLSKRIRSIGKTTRNWHKYYRKSHSILATLAKAETSQFLALLASLKKMKMKSVIFHSMYLIMAIPILIKEEFSH